MGCYKNEIKLREKANLRNAHKQPMLNKKIKVCILIIVIRTRTVDPELLVTVIFSLRNLDDANTGPQCSDWKCQNVSTLIIHYHRRAGHGAKQILLICKSEDVNKSAGQKCKQPPKTAVC